MRLLVCGDDDDISSLKEVNKCTVRDMTTHWGENMSIPIHRGISVKVELGNDMEIRRTEIDSSRQLFRNNSATLPANF